MTLIYFLLLFSVVLGLILVARSLSKAQAAKRRRNEWWKSALVREFNTEDPQ